MKSRYFVYEKMVVANSLESRYFVYEKMVLGDKMEIGGKFWGRNDKDRCRGIVVCPNIWILYLGCGTKKT